MDKREAVMSLLAPGARPTYVPAGFFLHFPPECHTGQAAVDKHLAFYRHTGMDFVKIQYERGFPPRPEIRDPGDWAEMPVYGLDFYEGQLGVVDGLVRAAKAEAPVIQTLYSPFMCAAHTVGGETLEAHLVQDPEATGVGLRRITESLLGFVRECIRLGVDGFYASTQGGERFRFPGLSVAERRALFERYVKPYDLAIWDVIDRECAFNVLHICDYHGPYDDLSPFLDYPGHVINCSLELSEGRISAVEVARMFDRPYMGGMDRKGVLAHGTRDEIRRAVGDVLREAPDRFVLAADCTVPSDIGWDNLRAAIDVAHAWRA